MSLIAACWTPLLETIDWLFRPQTSVLGPPRIISQGPLVSFSPWPPHRLIWPCLGNVISSTKVVQKKFRAILDPNIEIRNILSHYTRVYYLTIHLITLPFFRPVKVSHWIRTNLTTHLFPIGRMAPPSPLVAKQMIKSSKQIKVLVNQKFRFTVKQHSTSE